MKTSRSTAGFLIRTLCAAAIAGVSAPVQAAQQDETVIMAQADCYAVGQQIAAQNGGTLARASQSSQGGQPVCVVVILIPGKDGQRPRRQEIVVPQN